MTKTKPRDVQVAQIGADTTVLRSRTWERLKFETEYARQRGTTANAYLIQAQDSALIDPPGESFIDIFLDELQQHQYFQRLDYIILSHVNQNRITTLKRLLELAPYATVICSKPGAIALRAAFANQPLETWTHRDDEAIDFGIEYEDRTFKLHVVRDEEVLDLGNGHELQFRFVPTPRHPDALCTYDRATHILFTDKLFSAHVCDEPVFDEHWRQLDDDRRHFFECVHAVQVQQVKAALAKLDAFEATTYAPGHGPIVRHSLSRFTLDYHQWCQQQQSRELRVVLLYTSAYGNTGMMADAIAQGITQAGVSVQAINCESASPEEITRAVSQCDGFIVGSPTLGGHAPVQIQTALGIVLSTVPKTRVAGVFGSYGWSGEAVDIIESKLEDSGYPFGFETIRVKFKPTEETLQQCEAAGTAFAQALRKAMKLRAPRQTATEAQVDRTGQAVGRVIGSLCVVTAKWGNTDHGFLTSWVSQASFSPPGLTIAVAKDREAEILAQPGTPFVLNVLKEGKNLHRHFLKTQSARADRFADVETTDAANGCLILTEALSYLECTVQSWIECGDHCLLYATVDRGKVLEPTGITAVNHRKSGSYY
ncbi:diflavin flavoprotein [Oculatella sp. LEGE 06141]|uniref:diflavin flavoprotein n=1 Tax=Oculatella sp. LEGE 06141 TaxID=1828648 RepID=UPI0018810975|nr:diflavin flavoprotein [Oculatella sp. LEGE 06141]MBE9179947.1 diflavin flavoprotein [Oculatella sp. LEGE 06141]